MFFCFFPSASHRSRIQYTMQNAAPVPGPSAARINSGNGPFSSTARFVLGRFSSRGTATSEGRIGGFDVWEEQGALLPCALASGVGCLGSRLPAGGGFGARQLSGTFLKPPLRDGARGASLGEAFRRNCFFFFLFSVKRFVSDRLLMSSTLIVIWGPQRKDAGYFESKGRRRFRGTLP